MNPGCCTTWDFISPSSHRRTSISIYRCARKHECEMPNHAQGILVDPRKIRLPAPTNFWTMSGPSSMQSHSRKHSTVCAAEIISFHTQLIPCSCSSSRAHTSHTSKDRSASLLAHALQHERAIGRGLVHWQVSRCPLTAKSAMTSVQWHGTPSWWL
ncbi:hypothetical protein EJ03DRAFT_154438 [Teratosphaeria nubilosa]|uniref:Uncharacterized protein n=1 Tax=Teratosphaeria nubilosa TaxID=161662 RepID=A0A6G1LJP0_9PEZI|nr:hypothetical protein EJ03DRAFT_154438 [Teratosphaeria nubilosa]